MKDEIKEILDRMQELVKHKYDKEIHTYNLFDDIQDLLDYITNLQQEIKETNDSITWWTNRFKAVERDNKELKQENEKLKETIKEITCIPQNEIEADYEQ